MNNLNKFIVIDDKTLFYNEMELHHGRKYLDRQIAKENLQLFCDILNKSSLRYGLFYGTLLGAIREKNFIAHDQDTDIYMLAEDRKPFLKLLFEFQTNGLEVIRLNEDMISLMRKDEYIDVYFYKLKHKLGGKRVRIFSNEYEYPAEEIEEFVPFDFLGIKVYIPSSPEKFLESMYGKNWKIPVLGLPALHNTFYKKIAHLFSGFEKMPFFEEFRAFTKIVCEKVGI